MNDNSLKDTPIKPNNRNKAVLTEGPIKDHLVKMSFPMTLGIFFIISFQIADMFFISRLGTQYLAALSFTMPISMIVFSLILGMAISMSSVLSRQIGEGNHDAVCKITSHGVVLALIIGVFITLIGNLFLDKIFSTLGASSEDLPLIRDYMSIWFYGSSFIVLPIVGNAAIRATGDTKKPAIIMGTVALVNIILDPLLIYGLLGFPRLELQGAAIATIFANACAMLAGLYVLYFDKKILKPVSFKPDQFFDTVKKLSFIAIPAGITNTVQPFTNAVIISILAGFGNEAVAAFGVVTRIEAFAFVVMMGLAGGMAPIIGQNWGAKNFTRVNETLKIAFTFCVIWSLLIAFILAIFSSNIAQIFSSNTVVIEYCVLYFMIVPISYFASNLVPGWSSALNAMGLPHKAAIMIFLKFLVIQIPTVFLGAHLFGLTGVFAALCISNFITGIYFHLWNWKTCRTREALPAL
jgi:putative MATE family efflux protein